jgi:hypothetical protein
MKKNISCVALGIFLIALCLIWPADNFSSGRVAASAQLAGVNQSGETLEGDFEVIAECEETDGRTLYYLDTGKERVSVTFGSTPQEELRTGMHLSITGVREGDKFKADANSIRDLSQGSAGSSLVAGEIKVLVFLVNFQNNPVEPYTIEQSNNLMFNQSNSTSVTNYYREASYGQAWVTGDTVGWYTLPMDASTTACDQNSTIATLARDAAIAAGVNVNNYQKHMFVFPNMSCSYSGRGSIGGRDSWIDGSLILRTMAHELGHTIGLYHSKGMNCTNVISGTCVTTEYGHNADMIGQTGVTGHFHPYQKERLGWLAAGSGVVTVQGAGTYTISGLSVQDNTPKALKIAKSSSSYYYVEFRRPVGFDSFVSNNSATMNGVLITQDSSGAENYLLDMVPSTTSWSDSALTVGRSFTDPSTNMTITVVSVSASGAVVNVSYGDVPCVMSAPTVSANPSAVQWLYPGGSVSYTVTVTNNNSNTCSSNSFNVGGSVPAEWSSTGSQLNIPPGSTGSAFVNVATASSASGPYTVMLTAANTLSSGVSASVQRDISVLSSLNLSAYTDATVYPTGGTVRLSASVLANGAPVSGATVTFTINRPSTGRRTSSTVVSAITGANGVATYSYKLNRKQDPVGVYSVAASASFNGIGATGSTSFEVR